MQPDVTPYAPPPSALAPKTLSRSSTAAGKWLKNTSLHLVGMEWNRIRRHYNLTIDGEELRPGNVPLTGSL